MRAAVIANVDGFALAYVFVMAGLVPAIHDLFSGDSARKDVDARDHQVYSRAGLGPDRVARA